MRSPRRLYEPTTVLVLALRAFTLTGSLAEPANFHGANTAKARKHHVTHSALHRQGPSTSS